jgi:hypothetical protein
LAPRRKVKAVKVVNAPNAGSAEIGRADVAAVLAVGEMEDVRASDPRRAGRRV